MPSELNPVLHLHVYPARPNWSGFVLKGKSVPIRFNHLNQWNNPGYALPQTKKPP